MLSPVRKIGELMHICTKYFSPILNYDSNLTHINRRENLFEKNLYALYWRTGNGKHYNQREDKVKAWDESG